MTMVLAYNVGSLASAGTLVVVILTDESVLKRKERGSIPRSRVYPLCREARVMPDRQSLNRGAIV